jgi:hypothetical protein
VRLAVASVALAAVLVGPRLGAGAGPARSCPGATASARPEVGFNQRFAAYGDDNSYTDDWTGGDGTYSTRLPDGRDAWIFSDSFLGPVNQDGSRPTSSPFINNSMVIQDGAALVQTLHGGPPEEPTSLFVPSDGSDWYWPQEGVVEGDALRVFLQKYIKTGPGGWDFAWVGTDFATLSLPDLSLEAITAGPSTGPVTYGAAIVQQGGYTYIYGVEDQRYVNYLHLARAPLGNLLGTSEFWTGSGWSTDPADSIRLADDVGNGLSVTPVGGRYALITFADSDFFGHQIVLRMACHPWGPFGPETPVYDAPEHRGGLFSYNAHAHEQFFDQGSLLVSYDVNTFHGSDLWKDVTIYRPRFLRVDLTLDD